MKKQIILSITILSFVVNGQDYPPPTDLITIPTAGTLTTKDRIVIDKIICFFIISSSELV
jgi:hypothetical protein